MREQRRWAFARALLLAWCSSAFALAEPSKATPQAPPGDAASTEATLEPTEPPDTSEPGAAGDTPSPEIGKIERAREAFRLGAALAREQQWREALAAFERSARLHTHPGTTFNLGFCERALGRYTRARQLLDRAVRDSSPDGALSSEVRDRADAYLAEIDRLLVRAIVTLEPPDPALSVDGRPLEVVGTTPLTLSAGTLDPGSPAPPPAVTFVLLLDPGEHVFVVERDGGASEISTHHFEAGTSPRLNLGVKEYRQDPPEMADEPQEAATSLTPDRTPAFVAWGIGAAALLVGSGTGVAALVLANDLEERCGGMRCPPSEDDRITRLDRLTAITNVSFAVAGAGAASGLLLFWLAERGAANSSASTAQPTIAPWAGARAAGIEATLPWR
jgi:tetratricopeptide (TPR) repeat protein